ncbi:MAG: enoyl-CoA hydratase/isomerase family protein [Proteobacteria bacterium]|nr:enoyl-CoA hydratase/isomerase family protein [Pseudomonadota bacterium]
MEKFNFDKQCEFFSTKRIEDIVILSFKENLLFSATDLRFRDLVMDCLDRISKTESIKVVIIVRSQGKKGSEEYFDFYHKKFTSKLDHKDIHRLHNVFSQIILKIVDLNKIVIHASSGTVISLFLNVSLACDYRIIADDTVFQNPYLKLELVPIGGGAFFLSKRMGRSKALEILLSEADIAAHEAMKLGLVDEVVAIDRLEDAALDAARRFAQKPARSLAGLKKLINYSLKDLKDYLELEKQELVKIIGSLTTGI